MPSLKLEIVTPEKITFSDLVDSVVIPGAEGEVGVLPNHIPYMALLRPGELRYLKGGVESILAVGSGVAEILPTAVSVLTDMAVNDSEIIEAEVEAALKRAEEALKNSTDSDESAALQSVILKQLAQLNLKRRPRR